MGRLFAMEGKLSDYMNKIADLVSNLTNRLM